MSDLLNSVLAVKTHADSLVGLHELVKLLGKVLVLKLQNADVVVKSIYLSLEVGILIK